MIAKFNNINIIYSIFEILKEIKIEVNIKFYSKKIEIKDVSTDKTMAFDFYIDVDKLQEYKYTPDISVIGLNTSYMCSILKLIEKDNLMSLEVNENMRNKIIISSKNLQDHRESKIELELLEPEITETKNIVFENGAYITMKADDFYKLLNNIKVNCDTVKITCSEKTISFEGMAQTMNCKFEYSEEKEDEKGNGISIKMAEGISIVVGMYSIESILKFKKCTKIGTKIQIYIAENSLLCLIHTVGDIGNFKAIITPVGLHNEQNEEEDEEIKYNDSEYDY